MAFERQTAIKADIATLLEGQYHIQQGDDPNFLLARGKKISRVNLMGVIVSKEEIAGSPASLMLDDSTGRIAVRAFENLLSLNSALVGDIILLIGRPREYNSEIFVVPEIIKKLDDSLWVTVRKHELAQEHLIKHEKAQTLKNENVHSAIPLIMKTEHVKEMPDQQKPRRLAPADILIELVKRLDKGDGAAFEDLLSSSSETNTERIIDGLLKTGDLFEVRPGRLKVLE